MPQSSSINFFSRTNGYGLGGRTPDQGMDQYKNDYALSMIKNGVVAVSFVPSYPKRITHSVQGFGKQDGSYLLLLKGVGYGFHEADRENPFQIQILFQSRFDGEQSDARHFADAARHAQTAIAQLLNCSVDSIKQKGGCVNDLTYVIDIHNAKQFIDSIAALKNADYLPQEACETLEQIKANCQSELKNFLTENAATSNTEETGCEDADTQDTARFGLSTR